jgi:hypothetical protein
MVLPLPRQQRSAARRQGRQARPQRLGGLLHVVVEQHVGLVQRSAVGQADLRQRREGDGRQQEPQQPGAQRRRTRSGAVSGRRPAAVGRITRHALGTM